MHGKALTVKIQKKLRKNGKIVLVFCAVHDITFTAEYSDGMVKRAVYFEKRKEVFSVKKNAPVRVRFKFD